MKKVIYNISMLLAVAGFVVSCADNEGLSEDEKARLDQIMAEISADSDVPVSLSSGYSSADVTRASIESTNEGYFETDKIGVFMLANSVFDNTSVVNMNHVNWSRYDGKTSVEVTNRQSYPDKWSIGSGIYNTQASAKYSMNANGSITGTDICWEDGEVKYYPYGSPFAYSFFAYHPLTTDNRNITCNHNRLVVDLPYDGTNDVIWGCATQNDVTDAESKPYAYSAKFFHFSQNRNTADEAKKVTMQFKHLFSRIRFIIKPGQLKGSDGSSSCKEACKVCINKIAITNAPSSVPIVIANLNESTENGIIDKDELNKKSKKELYLMHMLTDGSYTDEINESPEESLDGSPLSKTLSGEFLLPPAPTDNQYLVTIYLTYNGNPIETPIPMTLTQNKDMEEGKTYYITLTIYAPETISLEAKLGGWEYGDSNTFKKPSGDNNFE